MSTILKAIINLLCAVLVVIATYLAIIMVQDFRSTSWVVGEPVIHDVYEDFDIYEYDLSSDIFYQNATKTGYELTKEYPVKNDFNGTANQYNMLINNKPCTREQTTAGQYQAQFDLSFFNLNGDIERTLSLYIEIRFYQSSIQLRIYNNADETLQGYLREYISYNGFVLRIIEGQYNREEIVSSDYVVYWLDYDSTIIGIDFYNQGETLVTPTSPKRDGYVFAGWSPEPTQFVNNNQTYIATYHIDNGNLLTQPIVYNLTSTDAYGLAVSINDNTNFQYFTDFPYIITVQVCYFDNKTSNDYSVLDEFQLTTNQASIVNDVSVPNATTGRHEIIVNGMSVWFEFYGQPSVTVDSEGGVHIGDDFRTGQVTIQAFNNISDANYLYDHIKIQITSLKVVSI